MDDNEYLSENEKKFAEEMKNIIEKTFNDPKFDHDFGLIQEELEKQADALAKKYDLE